ncbi:MAG TPA: hypothetical protein VFF76_04725 [Holophagaceae bacterium]|jgi:hypothetical protein|nr:hypothetical protein [Holophagaceae bacterium]
MAGTRPRHSWVWAAAVILPAGAVQAAPAGKGLPFDQVSATASYVVFYRVEGGHQFLFVYAMPSRRLIALEIDRKDDEDAKKDADPEEAGEIVHRLPVSKLKGEIQYLALDRLPSGRRGLLRFMGQTRVVFHGADLTAKPADRNHWLALDQDALQGAPR